MGEIGHAEKDDFLGGAIALLCPLQWPEPFGLVMIEAMACGTSVIAYPRAEPVLSTTGLSSSPADGRQPDSAPFHQGFDLDEA